MEKIKKNFGFGCMRLPMQADEVDTVEFSRMVDRFLECGFNYFDTAHGYLNGKSETALRECLTSRYPRDAYILTNKLSPYHFETNADIRPLFESQLAACGVDYFDFYLMHAQYSGNYSKYKQCRAYETALELKAEGKIRHMGISFHDKADFLEQILTDYPQIEVVQLQFNYVDYDDPIVEGRKCYEVCRKFGKPVIVMEPVKGGRLVNLPPEAAAVLDALRGGSHASYAIRYAAGFEGIFMVLSGMGNMEMVNDNVSYMQEFKPLGEKEQAAVAQVCKVLRDRGEIACTDCRYCMENCPQSIPIPRIIAYMNRKRVWNDQKVGEQYTAAMKESAKASDCIGCGLCESVCPQHLPVPALLQEAARIFEA